MLQALIHGAGLRFTLLLAQLRVGLLFYISLCAELNLSLFNTPSRVGVKKATTHLSVMVTCDLGVMASSLVTITGYTIGSNCADKCEVHPIRRT